MDFVAKPRGEGSRDLHDFGAELAEKVREAAGADVHVGPKEVEAAAGAAVEFRPGGLIAVGGSTGATETIRELLVRLPANAPPVAVVQHMPEMFTRMFARRLDELCALKVTEAVNGETLQPGHAYIAPGNWHLRVEASGGDYVARLDQEAPVNRHRPSVDVLFHSVARAVRREGCGGAAHGHGQGRRRGHGRVEALGRRHVRAGPGLVRRLRDAARGDRGGPRGACGRRGGHREAPCGRPAPLEATMGESTSRRR